MEIHHVALQVRDVGRSLDFYEGVLGLKVLRRNTLGGELRSAWLRAGGTVIMLERELRGRPGRAGSSHLLAFAATGLGEWEERLARAGIPVDDRTPHTLYVGDPDGHRVGISVYKLGE